MKAIVVYESHWGSTEAVARAIVKGLGSDAQAMNTDEATADVVAGADLVVAGAPVIDDRLPTDSMIRQLTGEEDAPEPPDVSHPALRTWLDGLAPASGWMAAFETRLWWSPEGATESIESKLRDAGYERLVKAERFIMAGRYGEVKVDELGRARQWGATLRETLAGK